MANDPGFSYGTLLGATIAKLYPNEIAGMILDGNINPNGKRCKVPWMR
jgi:pimeloyl-ACP methyl ester carboxylesterase